jgi:hypothetical protein
MLEPLGVVWQKNLEADNPVRLKPS